jgi:outer membrane immunogenic protein
MRSSIRFISLLGLASSLCAMRTVPAAAQDLLLRGEVGVDYNYVHTNAPPGGCGCFSMNGADAWLAYNLTRPIAVVAQIGSQHASNIGSSGTDLTLTSYLFGLRYSRRKSERFVPIGQILLGRAHASGTFAPGSAGNAGSPTAFAMATGVGLDVEMSERFAVRLLQADYYLTQFVNGVNDHQNNLRISTGLIFRFTKR